MKKLVLSLHMTSVYALLSELPSAVKISSCHLTHLTNLLESASKSSYRQDKTVEIRDAVKTSVGSKIPAKSLKLKHTIRLISELDSEISEIESEIKRIIVQSSSPNLTISGIGYHMGAMILAEIRDFSHFDSPDKILAYTGASPSTFQKKFSEGKHYNVAITHTTKKLVQLIYPIE